MSRSTSKTKSSSTALSRVLSDPRLMGPIGYGVQKREDLEDFEDIRNRGIRVKVNGKTYSRISMVINGTIHIDHPSKHFTSIQKKIGSLIAAEILFTTKTSLALLQYLSSFLIDSIWNSPNKQIVGARSALKQTFQLKLLSKVPCIQTNRILSLSRGASRSFIIPGPMSATGFADYEFKTTCCEIRLSDLTDLAESGFIQLEQHKGAFLGAKTSERFFNLGRNLDNFQLPLYLRTINLSNEIKLAGVSLSNSAGWIAEEEEPRSNPSTPLLRIPRSLPKFSILDRIRTPGSTSYTQISDV